MEEGIKNSLLNIDLIDLINFRSVVQVLFLL